MSMDTETYVYRITLTVEVEAFDESDAWDAIEDEFGVGTQTALTVTNCEYKEIRPKKK